MTPTPARIWWDASIQAYRLTSPFNRELVETFKLSVPASDRSFDPTSKVWTFTEKWLNPVVNLIEQVTRVKPQVVTRQQAEQAQQSSAAGSATSKASLDSVLLQFIKVLPYEAAQSAYRKAAMLLHPDRGGSMEKMSVLNSTWARIEKEVYNQ